MGGGLLLLRGMGQDGMRRRRYRLSLGRLCPERLRGLPGRQPVGHLTGVWLPGRCLLPWRVLRGLLPGLALPPHLPQFLLQSLDVSLLLCGPLLFRLLLFRLLLWGLLL